MPAVIFNVEGGPDGVETLTLIISLVADCKDALGGCLWTNFSAIGGSSVVVVVKVGGLEFWFVVAAGCGFE